MRLITPLNPRLWFEGRLLACDLYLQYFKGVYYLQKQFGSQIFDEGIKCNMDNFTMSADGGFHVLRSAVPYL